MKETQTFRPPAAKLISDGWGRYFLHRKIYRARTSSFYISPLHIFLRSDPPANLVHLFWGIGACILAPGGPRKAQWGHQRAFGAGSKTDCFSFSSLIEISSVKTSCGTPRISAILETMRLVMLLCITGLNLPTYLPCNFGRHWPGC